MLWLLLLLLTASPGAAPSPGPEPSPSQPGLLVTPPLESLVPAVREQIAAALVAVERTEKSAQDLERAKAHERLGRLLLLYEFPDAAASAFRRAVDLDSSLWASRYLLGTLDQQSGRVEAALEAFETVLVGQPNHLPSLLRRGELLLRLRRLAEARTCFQAAATLAPRSAAAHDGLGRVASAEKRFEEAIESFEHTLELQPHADAVYHPLAQARRRAGDLESAKEALGRVGDSRPVMDDPLMADLLEESVLARTFLQQGDRARRRGLVGPALSAYARALELDPTDAGVHYNLGTLYGELSRLEAAERHFRAAIEHDPTRADAYFNLGFGLRQQGRIEEAVEAFTSAVELEPGDSEARLELAITLFARGHGEEARREMKHVIAAHRDAELALRLLRYLRAMGDSEAAEGVLEDAFKRWPSDPRLLLEVADHESRQGRHELAADHYDAAERAAAGAEVAGRAALLAAVSRARAGQHAEAAAALEAVIENYGETPMRIQTLSHLLATAPEPIRDAARVMQLSARLPDSPQARETAAMAHAAAGRFTEATRLQVVLLAEAAASQASAEDLQRLEQNLQRYRAGDVAQAPW